MKQRKIVAFLLGGYPLPTVRVCFALENNEGKPLGIRTSFSQFTIPSPAPEKIMAKRRNSKFSKSEFE